MTSASRALLTLAALAAACGGEPPATAPEGAPPTPRATLLLEPPMLHIGDVAQVEVVVVTPPDHRVLPYHPPALPELWLLDAEALPIRRDPSRWVHRTRIRIRPRELGIHTWPASRVEVETADGETLALAVPARDFEVGSVAAQFPERRTPFGLLPPPSVRAQRGFWTGLAAGAAASLLLAGGAVLALRRRRDRTRAEAPPPLSTPWDWADRELARAGSLLERDASAAAASLAHALRRYVESRFGIDLLAATTQELAARRPALAVRSRWPVLVDLLERLDAERFRPDRPHPSASSRTERVARALEDATRFVRDSTPPEARR